MKIKIKKSNLEEYNSQLIKELVAIYKKSFVSDWSEQTWQTMLKPSNTSLITAIIADKQGDDKIIGFSLWRETMAESEIIKITTHPEFRRDNVGHQMLTATIESIRQQKCKSIFLEVRETNISAIKLYEKLGFTLIGRRLKYYKTTDGNYIDALSMKLELE